MRDFKEGHTLLYILPKSAGDIMEIATNEHEALVVTTKYIYSVSFAQKKMTKVAPVPEPSYYNSTFLSRDGSGNVFFSNGLHCFRYDRGSRQWRTLDEVPSMIVDIDMMPSGRVLVGTSNDGIYEYVKNGELINHLDATTGRQDDLHNSHIQHIYLDKKKGLVIITYHKRGMALYSHQENNYQMYHVAVPSTHYMFEDVIALADAGDNTFWLGTEDNGIYHVSADATH
jgi:ligand-binding sensor domain-containing protein